MLFQQKRDFLSILIFHVNDNLSTLVHKFGYVFYATVRKFPCTIVISVSRSPEHREGAARNLSRGGKTKRYLPEFTLSKPKGSI